MMAPSSFQMSATPLPSLPTTLLTHCVFNIRQKRNNSKANKNAEKKETIVYLGYLSLNLAGLPTNHQRLRRRAG